MRNGEGKYFDPKGKVKKVAFFEQGEEKVIPVR